MTAIRSVSARVAAGTALVLAVGLVAGCGGLLSTDSEADGDQGAPAAAAEDETAGDGTDVDVSLGDDGETVTLGDDEVAITVGADELPEWFPAEMPVPAEYSVLSATESQTDDGTLRGTIMTTPVGFDEVIALLDEGFAASGAEINSRDVGAMSGMNSGTFFVILDGVEWSVQVGDLGEEAETSVMYSTGTE